MALHGNYLQVADKLTHPQQLTEILAVKRHHGVEVNWSRYRDNSVTDPALDTTLLGTKIQELILNILKYWSKIKVLKLGKSFQICCPSIFW